MDVCLGVLKVLKESSRSRLVSYSVRNSILIISHLTVWDRHMHIFATTFLKIAVYIYLL